MKNLLSCIGEFVSEYHAWCSVVHFINWYRFIEAKRCIYASVNLTIIGSNNGLLTVCLCNLGIRQYFCVIWQVNIIIHFNHITYKSMAQNIPTVPWSLANTNHLHKIISYRYPWLARKSPCHKHILYEISNSQRHLKDDEFSYIIW